MEKKILYDPQLAGELSVVYYEYLLHSFKNMEYLLCRPIGPEIYGISFHRTKNTYIYHK